MSRSRTFRGHVVHSDEPTPEARRPDPERLVQGYYQAASTLNLLRAFTKGGFADLTLVHTWNREFVADSPAGQRYEALADEIGRALRFMQAIGIDLERERTLHEVDVWTSHEGLLLDYEEALTRQDSLTGEWYDCSAHMLWIGERTRDLDGAHVEFFSGVRNPVGVKIGPAATPDDAVALAERLNPARVPGRLTFITRMGADHVREALPPLLRAVRETEIPVVWVCDPMHANLVRTPSRHEDAPVRRDHGRARRLLRRAPRGGHVAGRRAHRVHRRGRHGVPRRLRGRARGAARPPLRDALRPAPERPPVARPRLPRRRAHARRPRGAPMRLAIVGTGLIGASLGLAARRAGAEDVAGLGRGPDALEVAAERGAVTAAGSLEDALREADDRGRRRSGRGSRSRGARRCSTRRLPHCTVTDVGSTKESVCAAAAGDARFVGGHPICGAETRGPERANADLFDGATWFLTPLASTEPERYRAIHGLVTSVGARPVAIDPAAHDRLVAVTSHLPHALANVLLNQAGASRVDGHEPLAAAGGSLRDMTRIAGANPRVWVDIFLDNREAVAAALAEHRRRVEQLEAALAEGDAGFLARWIGEAARQPPPDARVGVRRTPGALHRAARPRPRPPGRPRRDLPGARRGADQRLRLRPRAPLARARRDAHDPRLRRGGRGARGRAPRGQGYGVVVAPVVED